MSWTMPALLGAFHGLNPAMGWLFAVALGLQERRSAAVLRALPPIALGHAVSIAVVVGVFAATALVVPGWMVRIGAAGVLFAFATYLVVKPRWHPRGVGMRVGFRDLVCWSFLMSSAHGAGLMLLPLMVHGSTPMAGHAGHAAHAPDGLGVLGVHTLAMFAVMTVAAVTVFSLVGVDILRRAWLNLDVIWIGALVIAGIVTLLAT